MPTFHGKNGKVIIWDVTGASRDLSGDFNNVTMSVSRDNPTTTTFGQDTQSRVPGVQDVQFSLAGVYSPSANVSAASVLGELIAASLNTLFRWMPAGSLTGCPMFTACVLISQFEAQGPQSGIAAISATFQGSSGSLTRGTVA